MERNKILSICRSVSEEFADEYFEEKDWPDKTIRALLDQGLGGLVLSEEVGGLGKGLLELAECCEILATKNPSAGLCFGMHHVGAAVLAAKATDFQKKEFLEPIARGEHVTSLALSEPGTGSHFYYPQTQLLASNGHLTLKGKKSFITNGGYADSYVVSTMPADPEAPADLFSCVVLPKDSIGMEWGPRWTGMGMKQNSARSLDLNNVEIPSNHLLGEMGDQLWYVFQVIAPYFLTAMSGTYLGIARAAIDESINHLKGRYYTHSGEGLSHSSLVQHKVGKMYSRLEATRQLVCYASKLLDQDMNEALPAILSSKALVSDAVEEIVDQSLVLLGGKGYEKNSFMERLLLDSKAAHIMAPTTDILYKWTGRSLLELPILA